jgi:hypothetical protein
MTQVSIALNIRDLAGDLVLALEDEANGYWVRGGGMPAEEVSPSGDEIRSRFIDGASDVGVSLDRNEASVLVKVFGPTWASVEARYDALVNATRANAWVLEQVIEGVRITRRAGPVAVFSAPVTAADIVNKHRFVALSFKVQPGRTVTGV